ncbi:MAG: Uncharacterized protein AUK63_851 [bacterium P3]|nr:MAG: Uncharacterized protein AUK63_851 [bacterium P3]KWW41477.1 MAG: Uncharacterized protein F083_1039 [bacterium F083]
MKEIDQLITGLQRVGRLVRRMGETDTVPGQIEIDLLLQELRSMYSSALELEASAPAEQPVSCPDEADESMSSVTTPDVQPVEDVSAETPLPSAPPAAPMADMPSVPVTEEEDDPEVAAQPLMEQLEEADNDIFFDEAAHTPKEVSAPAAPEPAAEHSAMPEPTPAAVEVPSAREPEPEPAANATAPQRQSSLFDYIRPTEQHSISGGETLGDRLGRTGNGMRGETAQHKKVSDLRTVININDKFSFMKDLFQNNMKAYNDFIVQLNSIDDRETAQRRVDEVAQIYNWDRSSLTAKTFFSIFDRKF